MCLFSPSFRSSSMSCSTCQFHSSRDFRRRMYWIHGETRSPRRTSIRDSDWMSFQTCRSTCSSCLMLSFCPFCSGRFPYILLPLRASIYCTFVICGVLPPRVIQKGNICAKFRRTGRDDSSRLCDGTPSDISMGIQAIASRCRLSANDYPLLCPASVRMITPETLSRSPATKGASVT